MKRNNLLKFGLLLVFLFVAFFSIKLNSSAANFKYSDFDWDELLSKNRDFWTSTCEGNEDCIDKVLKTKEKFYIRLYELLDKYEKKGYYIDDNIIIETVFYGLDADSFSDPSDDKYNPYSIDEDEYNDKSANYKYIASDDGNSGSAEDYFKQEKDSLKTLINNFIGYMSICYGISDITPSTDQQCPEGLEVYGNQCAEKLETYRGTFFDSIGLSLFGNNNKKKCEEKVNESGYSSSKLDVSNNPEVNNDFFYEFLRTSTYFDKKEHLQSYFDVVLQYSGYDNMTEFYEAAEKDETLLDKYEDDIIEARETIIEGIKSVIETYGETSQVSRNYSSVCNSNSTYWWPIGGSEITESLGTKMSTGDPISTTINSKFGLRNSSSVVSGNHRGLDIHGESGVTPVIAVQSGTVVLGALGGTGSCVEGDTECGGKFGNYVMIQHTDGNYTIYAHMDTNSVIVKEGDTVSQGQVLGYVGSTGSSTGPHLHFEVRVGGNDSNSAQDPLNYINADNPRGSSTCNVGEGEIIIPSEYGNSGFFTYTNLTKISWAYNQKKVYNKWIESGAKEDRGVATIDGRYLIACTNTFGRVGDKIDFYLGDGTKLETIMMDEKSQEYTSYDHNPANMWGHNGGQQVIEFEITRNQNNSGDVGSWMGWSGQRVASATNLGENILN